MRSRLLSIVAGLLGACQTLPSPAPKPDPFLEATANAQKRQGLLSMYVDARSGKVMLELPPGAQGVVGAYLYVESLATGLGSNPVGLDRGQLGETR
ncbi:MAG: peptidase, partial [Myxococcota bacterium]